MKTNRLANFLLLSTATCLEAQAPAIKRTPVKEKPPAAFCELHTGSTTRFYLPDKTGNCGKFDSSRVIGDKDPVIFTLASNPNLLMTDRVQTCVIIHKGQKFLRPVKNNVACPEKKSIKDEVDQMRQKSAGK